MIDEHTEELAALYAFDLLEGAELAAFEAQLAAQADLQLLVRQLRESASALALTAAPATPSPGLRSRVLGQVELASGGRARQAEVVRFPAATLVPWAIAAGFALLAGWLGLNSVGKRAEIIELRNAVQLAGISRQDAENRLAAERIVANQQIATTSAQLAQLTTEVSSANQRVATLSQEMKNQGDLAQFKISTLASMLDNSPQALAVAIWNPAKQEGVFTVEKLPAAASDEDYELWVIDAQQPTPVSAGVFKVGSNGVARAQFKTESPVSAVAKFAVSREKKGGAPAHGGPKGKVIMISQ